VKRFAYTLHNLVGHPVSEVLHLLGLDRASTWIHDITLPRHP
jgi:hypothetical protein